MYYGIGKIHDTMLYVCTDMATNTSPCNDGDLRLIGGSTPNQGRLEVCINSAWGSVCDSVGVFTRDEAKVACRQLGILQVEGLYSKRILILVPLIIIMLLYLT